MASRYSLRLLDAATGIVLNQAGRHHLDGQPNYAPTFDSEDAALQAKEELLNLFPWAEVHVLDSATQDQPRVFRAPEHRRARFEHLRHLHTIYTLAFPLRRLFMKAPLDPWNPNSYSAADR